MIPLCLILGACGGGEVDHEYMWGEASQELSNDWCQARERCLSLDELELCIRHNLYHLCELTQTCEIAVPEAEAMAADCAAELAEIDGPNHAMCINVYYGFVPEACGALLDLMPDGE